MSLIKLRDVLENILVEIKQLNKTTIRTRRVISIVNIVNILTIVVLILLVVLK
jgi:hypothetical protein